MFLNATRSMHFAITQVAVELGTLFTRIETYEPGKDQLRSQWFFVVQKKQTRDFLFLFAIVSTSECTIASMACGDCFTLALTQFRFRHVHHFTFEKCIDQFGYTASFAC